MLIGDTVNSNWIFEIPHKLPRTNPDSSRMEDLNQGPPDFKSSALSCPATLPPITFSLSILSEIFQTEYVNSVKILVLWPFETKNHNTRLHNHCTRCRCRCSFLNRNLSQLIFRAIPRNTNLENSCDLVHAFTFVVCDSSFNFKTLFLQLVIYGSVLSPERVQVSVNY